MGSLEPALPLQAEMLAMAHILCQDDTSTRISRANRDAAWSGIGYLPGIKMEASLRHAPLEKGRIEVVRATLSVIEDGDSAEIVLRRPDLLDGDDLRKDPFATYIHENFQRYPFDPRTLGEYSLGYLTGELPTHKIAPAG